MERRREGGWKSESHPVVIDNAITSAAPDGSNHHGTRLWYHNSPDFFVPRAPRDKMSRLQPAPEG